MTALRASITTAALGQSVTFTATVSDLSAGGATPNGGTISFSDQGGALGTAELVDGVAEFTTSILAAGTDAVTATFGGTGAFASSTTGTIVTAAGNGTAGYRGNNGPATAAELNGDWGLAVNSTGDLFIVDGANNVVREVIKATGYIVTVAGNGTAGYRGDNGAATSAELNNPNSVSVDAAGDLFISDQNNNRIREVVKSTGIITTVAGNGTAGFSGDNAPATSAEINSPRGIGVDAAGDIFIADWGNNRIREVVAATGNIITVAGTGIAGYSGDNGLATSAKLNAPNFVAVDPAGNLFIGDAHNNAVREVVKATSYIETVAGDGTAGYTGDNGLATASTLNGPLGVALDSLGDLFIADDNNNVVREIVKATGDIITVAGTGIAGYSGNNGQATAAKLNDPGRVAVDSAGDLFIADRGNSVVRELTPAVTVTIGSSGALPTMTAVRASTASAVLGQFITFIATVSDLSAGGATPDGGTVTFSDQNGALGSVTLVDGAAAFTITSLPSGTTTITASYGGTADFAASATGTIVTAIGDGSAGYEGDNGPATAAEINGPGGMAIDSAGDLFFGDFGNNVVRELVKATGDIITVAGDGTAGYSGDNGPATDAELNDPRDVAVDSAGNLFIADLGNNVIREVVKATGIIITVAGTGTAGYSGDGGPATGAELNGPRGAAVDSAGNFFFADTFNNRIREIVVATGEIITVAGDGSAGYSGDGGPATAALLNGPNSVAIDAAGDVFFTDGHNYAIREVVKTTGDIITVAGDGTLGYYGDGGPATAAELDNAYGVAVDSVGDVFIADGGNFRVREVVKATGEILTIAGDGGDGYSGDGGAATAAEIGSFRVVVDSAGDVFIADQGFNVIREVTPAVTGSISTSSALPTLTAIITSTTSALPGQSVTFTATVSDLSAGGAVPNGGTVTFSDQSGTLGSRTLVDGVAAFSTSSLPIGTNTITAAYGGTSNFAPSATGTIVTAAGNGTAGYSGDNVPATAALLNNPFGLAVDSAGDLFIADFDNNLVREVEKSTGDIVTVAGTGVAGYSGDGGLATAALLDGPRGLGFDAAGDLFISDMKNNAIREVVKATGDIITIAGTGTAGYSGDNGPAIAALLSSPRGLAVDSAGNVYFADWGNNLIREIIVATGEIITIAGDDTAGYSGDDGPATAAELNQPNGVAIDAAGNVFIVDGLNNAVREVLTASGNIITIAGDGTAGYSGDDGPAAGARLNSPFGLGFDSAGDLFIADTGNNVVREVLRATGNIITVAGNGGVGYLGDNGPATAALMDFPSRVVADAAGDVFIADNLNDAVREITPAVTVTISVASQIVITSPPLNLTAGSRGQVTVELEDTNGYPSTSGSSQTVDLSTTSTAGAFYATAISTTPITSIAIPAGDSSASFYYRDTAAGNAILTVSDNAVSSAPTQAATISPGVASSLIFKNLPGGIIAGIAFSVEVDAVDDFLNLVTSFGGPVTVGLANGSGGTLTGDLSATAMGGVANLTNLLSDTSGSVSLSASSDAGSIDLTSPPTGSIAVSPAQADHFAVTTSFATQDVAGTIGTVTVTAEDHFDNPASSGPNQYEGTIDLNSTDALATGVPTSYTVTASDAGSHTFTNVVLEKAGGRTITATDSLDLSLMGAKIVTVVPGAAQSFVVTTTFANPDAAGAVGTVTVTAKDAYGNTDGSGPNQYLGTVALASTASQAGGLPASHAFTAINAGTYTFPAVALKTAGAQTLTATDSVDPTKTGAVAVTVVSSTARNLVVTTNFAVSDVAGTAGTVTVTAEDAYNNIVSGGPNLYLSTVNLNDADTLATGLPTSYTFTAGDAGSHTFYSVVMKTAGMLAITATDSVNHAITGAATLNVVPAAVKNFVVTTSFANPDVAGTVGTVVVTAVDAYGNAVGTGPNQYEGTANLTSTDGQTTGLPATHLFTTSDAGSFRFADVVLKTAGAQVITATDSAKASIAGTSSVTVTAAPSTQLVFTTSPPNPIIAGQAFTVVVAALDPFHNVDTTFNADVTISLPGDSNLKTTVQAKNGVATFTGLVVDSAAAQGQAIAANSGSLAAGASTPVTVKFPPPVVQAPTVISEQPVKIQLFNKKGKKTGKPLSGFALKFSTTMSSSTAGLPANYRVYSTVVKKVKKKTTTSLKAVSFTSAYNPATNTVTLEVKSTKPFAKAGGEITLSGVTDQAGTPLDASDTTFLIGKNGKTVGLL